MFGIGVAGSTSLTSLLPWTTSLSGGPGLSFAASYARSGDMRMTSLEAFVQYSIGGGNLLDTGYLPMLGSPSVAVKAGWVYMVVDETVDVLSPVVAGNTRSAAAHLTFSNPEIRLAIGF